MSTRHVVVLLALAAGLVACGREPVATVPAAAAQTAPGAAILRWASYGGTPALNAVRSASLGTACPAMGSALAAAQALPDMPDLQANVRWRLALAHLSVMNVACLTGEDMAPARQDFASAWNQLQARLRELTS